MSFYGLDVYLQLGMLLSRMLDLAEVGHTITIRGTTIRVAGTVIGSQGVPLTMSQIESALRSVTLPLGPSETTP